MWVRLDFRRLLVGGLVAVGVSMPAHTARAQTPPVSSSTMTRTLARIRAARRRMSWLMFT